MKYCVNSRVNPKVLEKADEIKFAYRDRKAIPDFFERYPNTDITLQIGLLDEIDWNEMNTYKVLGQGHFIMCVSLFPDIKKAKERDIRCFYGFPINAAIELEPLMTLGVEYIRIGAPLFFSMKALKEFPIRVIANVPYMDNLPRANGVNGVWIRPEDVEMYSEYVDMIEFENIDINKEELLYRVYAEDKCWKHGLDLIIENLNYPGNNRMILSDMTKFRLDCGQRCALNKQSCQICWRLLNLADPEKIRDYKAAVYGTEEEPSEE